MSLAFSNTTTKNGIIQQIERNCGFNDGEVSGNPLRLAQFTGDINTTLDHALALILKSQGTWQFDDNNQTDYPIIYTDIVSGQQDYPFTTDGSGNLILDVFKVFIKKSPTGRYEEIDPVDAVALPNEHDGTSFANSDAGIPSRYDKNANALFLDKTPNYDATDGIMMYVNRETTYFTTSDTTKKPGFAGIFHEYLALRPSYYYCLRNQMPTAAGLGNEMLKMEKEIKDYYSARPKDERRRLSVNRESNK